MVEKDRIIDGSRTAAGDVVLGLPSSGPHSNGFSLIRKILEVSAADLAAPLEGTALIDRLMAPTRIYVKPLLELMGQVEVHGLAHITGGGLIDNIPRVIRRGTGGGAASAAPGTAIRCSNGCRRGTRIPMKKCIGCSIAASA